VYYKTHSDVVKVTYGIKASGQVQRSVNHFNQNLKLVKVGVHESHIRPNLISKICHEHFGQHHNTLFKSFIKKISTFHFKHIVKNLQGRKSSRYLYTSLTWNSQQMVLYC